MVKIPTKSTNCDENTSYSFNFFSFFFRITAFSDEIFDITFVATVAKYSLTELFIGFPSNAFQT